jgi:peptidoglycan hydrolase CwlO-like protein
MTFEQTMHTIESHLKALQADYDNLKSKHEQVLETNSKLASTIQEQEQHIDDLKHSVFVERDTSAKYARLLATAKEENRSLKEINKPKYVKYPRFEENTKTGRFTLINSPNERSKTND